MSIERLLLRAQHEDRIDDTLPKIEERLQFYSDAIQPTETYLKQETKFFVIDGRPDADTVEKSIHGALGIV